MRCRVACLMAVALIIVGACERNGSPHVAAPPPSATATAERAASSSPTAVAQVTPTVTAATVAPGTPRQSPASILGTAADLPGGVALIVQTGCFQCDGPPTGLLRLYRDASGTLHSDTLIRRPEGGRNQPSISSVAVGSDGYGMAVTVCSRGYCGALAPITDDAETAVLHSRDGGITWQELERRAGAFTVVAVGGAGVLVAGPFGAAARGIPLRRLPEGTVVQPPAGAEDGRPIAGGAAYLWVTFNGRQLLREDGTVLFAPTGANSHIGAVLPEPGGGRVAMSWWDGRDSHLTIVDGSGPRATVSLGAGYATAGAWLDSGRLMANVAVPTAWLPKPVAGPFVEQLPAVIDLAAATVSPVISPFLEPPYFNGRNRIEAAVRGPLVRVVTPADCLNVREAPDAALLACVADGVLLGDLQEEREAAGDRWWRVRLPDGRAGWASAAYLAR